MTQTGEVSISGVRLTAPTTWVFHEFENLILARPDSQVGTLQISTAFRFDCKDASTADECKSIARSWLSISEIEDFQVKELGQNHQWLGSASIGPKGAVGHAWFLFRNKQLLLGLFQWASKEMQNKNFIQEVETIIASAYCEKNG